MRQAAQLISHSRTVGVHDLTEIDNWILHCRCPATDQDAYWAPPLPKDKFCFATGWRPAPMLGSGICTISGGCLTSSRHGAPPVTARPLNPAAIALFFDLDADPDAPL